MSKKILEHLITPKLETATMGCMVDNHAKLIKLYKEHDFEVEGMIIAVMADSGQMLNMVDGSFKHFVDLLGSLVVCGSKGVQKRC